jgi:His/Glu/Gln/Arg/opine family amino acid ABC transporter permease subunit
MNHMNFSAITSNLSYLMIDGFSLTIKLTVLCALTGFVLGTVLAVVRLYGPQWAQTLVASYVNLVRSIPLILVIFWVYFLSPCRSLGSGLCESRPGECIRIGLRDLQPVRSLLLLRDHPRRRAGSPKRAGISCTCTRLEWRSGPRVCDIASSCPTHGTNPDLASDRAVSGCLSGLCTFANRLCRRGYTNCATAKQRC